MNWQALLNDYGIPSTHEQSGWINIRCPFCDDTGQHLGLNTFGGYGHCWKCGGKSLWEVIEKLSAGNPATIKELIARYNIPQGGKESPGNSRKTPVLPFLLPSGTCPLQKAHQKYLIKRRFDPISLERTWKVKGTGNCSYLESINYSRRIIIPIFWEGKMVTFQGRDITDQAAEKYMACPKSREIIHHKDIVYAHPDTWKQRIGVCVEGVTDVWRLGIGAMCTFGIKYTPAQFRVIRERMDTVYVMFDGGEKQAQRQAKALVADLQFAGVKSTRIEIQGDPGDMDQEEAKKLMKQLIPTI